MRKTNIIALGMAAALLTASAALLPAQAVAGDGYRSAPMVAAGYRDHRGYRDYRGYDDRHWGGHHRHHHYYRGHAPYGRAYGYYAPRYPTTYYRYYPAPRYYDYGRSGWSVDLHYYFSD
jgi:hypothetical protein